MSLLPEMELVVDPGRKIEIILGNDVRLPMESVIQCPRIEIGDYSRINGAINIRGSENCVIGRYCALGYGIHILTTDHHTCYPNVQIGFQRKHGFKSIVKTNGPVVLGHNVWIGENVTILPGVSIGNGAVIGAGSVLTKNIASYSVNYGNPSRQHRWRFSQDIIDQLETIQWWDWPEERIKQNASFFNLDLERIEGDISKYIDEDFKD